MLFGSLSGLPAAGLLVRSTRATGLVSTAAGGLAARSSTRAGACSSGVVAQPAANAAAARVANMIRRMAFLPFSFPSFYEWSPGGLTHVSRRNAETLLDAAVRRHRRQHAAPADHRGEQDHPPVGREARRLVAIAVGDDLHLTVREIEQRHLELAFVKRDIGEGLAVGTQARRHIIASLEGDALRLAAGGRHAVDLRAAAAVGGEVDPLAVAREARLGIDRRRAGKAAQAAAVGVDEEDLRAALARQRDGELAAVGRPGRRRVRSPEVGYDIPLPVEQRVDIDHRLLVLERDIGELPAVRRPGGRDDRLE